MHSPLLRRALRFALTGLFVTAIHVVAAVSFMHLVLANPPLANGFAFLVATLVSYLINTLWSFSSQLRGRTLGRFVVVSVGGFWLAMLVAWVAQGAGLDYRAGIAAVALVIPVFTFILHNFWTYR
ncbi:GtrA family protein [Pseudomonas citrulli]|uniref:GtrA family protein n=1 Tax=Pseudomonas citrulli TaxID=3064347 RepID=A0ABT9C4P4_9PSED|nr:GtrA family protein [Pseudomonas sp. K18]MDO7899747.1 GtrA family protein [Pseudomonas sp. K18]